MPVVADSSPLILLGRLDRLHLLQRLFGRVVVPREVFREVTSEGDELPGSQAVRAARLKVIEAEEETDLQASLRRELDQGEAAAIALAKSLPADLLLIDERQGRSVAQSLGLRVMGTLGVLIMAKQEGLIDQVRPLLDCLRDEGAWIGEELYWRVLEAAGETPEDDAPGE